ncbi:M48 family metalloprotease [Spongiimicrobium sp. 2-473A-2-J]|uniref:M48 family metalloprotease n=1 Tax=Eudoraea algarum TaxID=3417568 RepID=UPI003D363FAA
MTKDKLRLSPTILFFLFVCLKLQAQDPQLNYLPENRKHIENYLKSIEQHRLATLDGDNISEKRKIYREKTEKFIQNIQDSVFIFGASLTENLKPLLQRIYKGNPQIDTDNHYFFFHRSSIPNAACYGDGSFAINMGMFTYLENDDELAFILSHEMAHLLLNHVNKKAERYIDTINSKAIREKSKAIKKQRYNTIRDGRALVKDLTYELMSHSRHAEAQADSLGLILLKNTGYNPHAALSALTKLGKLEQIRFIKASKIDSILNFESFPFRLNWIEEEETLFNISESSNDYAFDKDSLKTHPEIPYRLEKLHMEHQIEESQNTTNYLPQLKQLAKKQQLHTLLDFNQLDLALYESLIMIQDQQEHREGVVKTAVTLKKMYLAKKRHKMGKYVPQSSPFSEEIHLNRIRSFVHKLELKHIRKIGYYFCHRYGAIAGDHIEFLDAKDFFESLNQ